MSALKDKLLKNNATVNWLPEAIGKGRFGNFLENVLDWSLSRERYWGTPLPIWVCGECEKTHTVGSKAELKELGGITGDIELHKPYVDNVTFKCTCGGVMKRTPEVIDCWYDSGAMPFAQLHYPFENKELFEKIFPADFISEAVDQTRGWFYTLLAISTILFDKSPFKNCLVLGHVCDKNGEKMSKHKGNVVDPWSVVDTAGADAVRWYFYTASSPWLPSRFYADAVIEAQRKFLGTLWNVYSFFVLYADIDGFDPSKHKLNDCKLTLMDKWILSELNSLVSEVDGGLERYNITDSARTIQDFVDNLSKWYVRRSRDRFWGSGMTEDKKSAFCTLWTVLTTLSKLTAPFVPFIAESVWQNLVVNFLPDEPKSVHLADFPVSDKKRIDKKLNLQMQTAINIAQAGRAVRSAVNIKNRQPLGKMYVVLSGLNLSGQGISDELLNVSAEEVNVLSAEVISDAKEYITYDLKPQLKTLGKKYGAKLSVVKELMASEPSEILDKTKNGGVYKRIVDGFEIELTEDDLLVSVKSKEGFNAETAGNATVILDTTLTEKLVELGIVREIVSKIQTMRKESSFVVTDRIKVGFSTDSKNLKNILTKYSAEISSEVLAEKIEERKAGEMKEWDINGEALKLGIYY
jgi:isoleucyl-tRNA synthetase